MGANRELKYENSPKKKKKKKKNRNRLLWEIGPHIRRRGGGLGQFPHGVHGSITGERPVCNCIKKLNNEQEQTNSDQTK